MVRKATAPETSAAAQPTNQPASGRPVLVTTAHRGVFFGYAAGSLDGETVTLTRARNAVYWSSDVKGFLGLATTGPTKNCKIGPAADELTLRNVTAVVSCTPAAVEAWEGAPWMR